MTGIPQLEDLLRELEQLADVKVDADTPISQLDISSLDLVEWTVLLEDRYSINLENLQLDEMRDLTPRLLYMSVFGKHPSPPGPPPDHREV